MDSQSAKDSDRSIHEEEVLPLSQPRLSEPCKFPPLPRRRFSLIADRSSCWVINVRLGPVKEAGGSEDEEKTIQEEKNNQARGKKRVRRVKRKVDGTSNGTWRNRSVDLVNRNGKKGMKSIGKRARNNWQSVKQLPWFFDWIYSESTMVEPWRFVRTLKR